jgi:hypothetical protein
MPLTYLGKDTALEGLRIAGTNDITHVGLFDADPADNLTTPFGVAATDLITATAHGFSAGDLVVFTALTGGTGLVVGDPYFVIATGLTANDFRVSRYVGGTQVDFTSDITAGTVRRLVEISGGSPAYARIAATFSAATNGSMNDATDHVINVPAGATVDYVGYFNALTTGALLALDDVAPEMFGAQGTYTVTDGLIDLNA